MPPKRKAPSDDHPHVTVGKAKIGKRANGKRLVEKDIRKNVLLFLENLQYEDAKNYSQDGFQNKLSTAVSGAMDPVVGPVVGPEAFIDLSKYHVDLPEAFGNREVGQLMTKLLPRNAMKGSSSCERPLMSKRTSCRRSKRTKKKSRIRSPTSRD